MSVSATTKEPMVRFWDAATGQPRGHLIPFCMHTHEAVLSPDGRCVATRYEGYTDLYARKDGKRRRYGDEVVYLWDAETGKPLFLLHGHQDRVTSVAFSADSRRLVTGSWDRTARIWDVGTGQEVKALEAPSSVSDARFSPDGRSVLMALCGQTYSNYGPGSPRPKTFDEPQPARMTPINWDEWSGWGWGGGSRYSSSRTRPDSALARIADAATGQEICALKLVSLWQMVMPPSEARFSCDGRLVVLLDGFRTAGLWDSGANKVIVTLSEPEKIAAARFSPDGKTLAVAAGAKVRLRDTATGQARITLHGHSLPVIGAEFSPDGSMLVTTSHDKTCRVWDTKTGAEVIAFSGHERTVSSAVFSPDGRRVVTASDDRTVRIWHLQPPRDFGRPLTGHKGPVWDCAFSPDGRRLVTASKDTTAIIWDVASARQTAVLRGYADQLNPRVRGQLAGPLHVARFSPDGRRIVTAGDDAMVTVRSSFLGFTSGSKEIPFTPAHLWDASSGKETVGLRGHLNGVDFAQFSADGTRLITLEDKTQVRLTLDDSLLGGSMGGSWNHSNTDRRVRVWHVETGQLLAAIKPKDMEIESAALSSDSRRVLTCNHSNANPKEAPVRVWDAENGTELMRLNPEGTGTGRYATFSPDGTRVYIFAPFHARCHDASTGKLLTTFADSEPGQQSVTHFAVFSPDGRRLVTLGENQAVVWDAATLRPAFGLAGHERKIYTAAFSNDGKHIVTASDDETARIWDAATGEEEYTLSGHHGPVRCAVFSPDSQSVATASEDGTARIWPIDPVPIAKARKPRDLTAAERKRFGISGTE
jgi:WD40 repeat protein